LNTLSIFCRLG